MPTHRRSIPASPQNPKSTEQIVYTSPFPDVPIHPYSSFDTLFTNNPRFRPSRPAYIDSESGATITMGELKNRIEQLAQGIRLNFPELSYGSTIAIFSTNHIEYATMVHGIVRSGMVVSPANPSYSVKELTHQLKDSGAKVLFLHPNFKDVGFEAAQAVGIPKERILFVASERIPGEIDACPSGFRPVVDLLTESVIVPDLTPTADVVVGRESYLCYSSGTTGLSKGVRSSQYNIVSNVVQTRQTKIEFGELPRGDGVCSDSECQVWTGCLPFFHIYGLMYTVHLNIYNACPVVVFPRFHLELFMSSVMKYHITTAIIVPPILINICNDAEMLKKYKISTYLRNFISGAAPLGRELADLVLRKTAVPVVQVYGMTEMSPLSHLDSMRDSDPECIGQLLPTVQARLVDPTTNLDILDGNSPGELLVRGPNIMLGYLNNVRATEDTLEKSAGGWLHTGDMAVYKNEKFYIVDRIKELIKYKGFQVAPAELESHLLSCPDIADAAVIGQKDFEAGELPRAFVVLQPGSKANERQIRDFVDAKVGATKRLRGGVIFVKEIPKSASGKILRRVLRDQNKTSTGKLDNGSMYDYKPSKL